LAPDPRQGCESGLTQRRIQHSGKMRVDEIEDIGLSRVLDTS
jgi:hypothetical protein